MTYANFSRANSSSCIPFLHTQSLDENNAINSLIKKMKPLCKEHIDAQGNRFRFREFKNVVLGTITKADGSHVIIPTRKIVNPCANPCSLSGWQKLGNSNLDIVYNSHSNELVIFPHLKASAKDEVVSKVAQTVFSSGERKPWYPPSMLKSSISRRNHMFRDAPGHLKKDTPENRAYILSAVSDPENLLVENRFSREIYYKIMPDDQRVWAHVEKGCIINGGRDNPWKKWKLSPYGELTLPLPVTIFREKIQIDRLTNVFNTTIGENYWEPHPLETVNIARDVGGVRHETGIILDLLEELQSSLYNDYMFFIPETEGVKLLDKREILQIVQEIAKGIYLHDTIPFFSLNMNPQHQNYSVIHPFYQNTYVGYVISMLDYYLKGFWTGQLFDQTFIQEWNKNPIADENLLKEHILSMKELCQLSEENSFLNFDQILQNLIQESSLTPEQLAILAKETQHLVLSCKILGKQKSIPKHQNLFVLDGEVQLIHTVEWKSEGADQELCHQILDRACTILCQQIQDIGFRLPQMQKWLSALQIMNFFSIYFRTLEQAEKIPVFSEAIQVNSKKICPSIFPPVPYPSGPHIKLEPAALLQSLSSSHKQILQEYCQKDSEDIVLKESLRSIITNSLQTLSIELPSENTEPCINTILSALRSGYRAIDEQIEQLFIDLNITTSSYHSRSHLDLLYKINETKDRTKQAISRCKSKIACKKTYDQDSKLLESLLQIQTALEQASKWIDDPLSTLVEKESWLYDIEATKLVPEQKNSSGEILKVYGGYEPKLYNMNSQESTLAKNILQQDGEKLDMLEYEDVLSIDSLLVRTNDSLPSGIFFKLPIEDSFPISSYGMSYNAIQLFSSSINSYDDHIFYTLLQSIREEDLETFNALQKTEIDYNRLDLFGRGAIHYAALSTSTHFLRTLIDKKANLITRDSQGMTALHHAATIGNLAAIELLLSADQEIINKVAINGETPIYLAVHKNQTSVVQNLIAANADLNIKPNHGYNLLLSAIHNGHEEMALLLLQSGKIDVNYKWRNDKTALNFTIEMQMEKLLEALLRSGVDRNHTYLGKKPILIAQEQGWEKGVEILNTNFTYQEATCTIL